MESSIDYKDIELKADDFRELSILERKLFMQRIIDLIMYDPSKFNSMVKLIKKWEKVNNEKQKS